MRGIGAIEDALRTKAGETVVVFEHDDEDVVEVGNSVMRHDRKRQRCSRDGESEGRLRTIFHGHIFSAIKRTHETWLDEQRARRFGVLALKGSDEGRSR